MATLNGGRLHLTSAVRARRLYPSAPRASLRAFRAPLNHIAARRCSPQRRRLATVRRNIDFLHLFINGSPGPPAVGLTQHIVFKIDK